MENVIDYGNGVTELVLSPSVSAILNEIDSGAEVFDETAALPVKLSGKHKSLRGYVPRGSDSTLPCRILKKIRKDGVMSQNKLFNTLACHASGIRIRKRDGEGITSQDIAGFFKYSRMPCYFPEQATGMKHFFFSVTVIILSGDGKKTVKIRHREACHIRFETCDPVTGRIERLFYASREGNTSEDDEIEVIPVPDIWDPPGNLETRTGKNPNSRGQKQQAVKDRKFAVINSFPVAGCKYCPFVCYRLIFLSGLYGIRQMIPAGKKAKFRHQACIRYHVEVHLDYREMLCREEKITGPEKKAVRIKKEKAGSNRIEDLEEVSNMICHAGNIHPGPAGAASGKSKNSFSGSVQRGLFTVKQASENPTTIFYRSRYLSSKNTADRRISPATSR
jgi:hypothetical protein